MGNTDCCTQPVSIAILAFCRFTMSCDADPYPHPTVTTLGTLEHP